MSEEIYGDDYLRPLRQLMERVPQLRMHPLIICQWRLKAKDALEKQQIDIEKNLWLLEQAEERYGVDDDQPAGFDAVKESWRHVKVHMFHDDKQTLMAYHAQLIADVRALITRVGDSSNLILDPDLDSYYLMEAVLLKLPAAQEPAGPAAMAGHRSLQAQAARSRSEGTVDRAFRPHPRESSRHGNRLQHRVPQQPGEASAARLEKPLEGLSAQAGLLWNWFEKEDSTGPIAYG